MYSDQELIQSQMSPGFLSALTYVVSRAYTAAGFVFCGAGTQCLSRLHCNALLCIHDFPTYNGLISKNEDNFPAIAVCK